MATRTFVKYLHASEPWAGFKQCVRRWRPFNRREYCGGSVSCCVALSVVGCWLLVVGCRLSVVGCWLLVVGGWWLVVGCWLLVVGCWLLVVGCWLLAVGCWSLVVGRWLLVVGCWLLANFADALLIYDYMSLDHSLHHSNHYLTCHTFRRRLTLVPKQLVRWI
jgi:hypothetical protein